MWLQKKPLERFYKKRHYILLGLLVLLLGVFSYKLITPNIVPTIYSAELECPKDYSTEQCYEYLQKLRNQYASQRSKLQKEISQLKKRSNSLQSLLELTKREIQLLQIDINDKQLNTQILKNEIDILQKSINEIQIKLDQQQQEAEHIIKKLDEYTLLKYSLNTISWNQVLLQGDIYSVFELMTYLDYFLAEYKNQLNYLRLIQKHIEEQKSILKEKQDDLQEKETLLENDLIELTQEQKELEVKKAQQQNLIKEIDKAYNNYLSRLQELNSIVNNIDNGLSIYLEKLYQEGKLAGNGDWVDKGSIVGFQGHTGCSFGSHLHFEIFETINGRWYSRDVTWRNYLVKNGHYLQSSVARSPLDGAYITQFDHGRGNALDLISTASGNHTGEKYCKKKDEISCPSHVYNYSWYKNLFNNEYQTSCFNLNGEGAPVHSILPGYLYKGTDKYGSHYAIVIHEDVNAVSIYYHLK